MMNLSHIAEVLQGRMVGEDVRFDGVSTDTRSIAHGDLFVALKGERFDAAGFVAQAAQAGAVAALVNEGSEVAEASCPIVYVADTRLALGKLAAHWRSQKTMPLVAITGSNGKTTVKEMLAAILRQAAGSEEGVLATLGNLNNDIGMPLTLLKLRDTHHYAVIEMGMNHPGEIDYLTHIARPDVALVNNASGAHLQGLGSIEGVAKAKGEIFAGLAERGTAIINADDAYAGLWRALTQKQQRIEFALEHSAPVQGSWQANGYGGLLRVQTPAGEMLINLQVPGEHNARNALAAIAAALVLHIPFEVIMRALSVFNGVGGRLQRKAGQHGATLIDDTYNANPASMRAALEVLAQQQGKRIFVLGDMGELGEDAARFHREIGEAARELGIDKLLALGDLSAQAVQAFGPGGTHFTSIEELQQQLSTQLDAQTTVLVKGSRFMKMERVVQACAATQEEICCSH